MASSYLPNLKVLLLILLGTVDHLPRSESKCSIPIPGVCTKEELITSWMTNILSTLQTSLLDGSPTTTGSTITGPIQAKQATLDKSRYYMRLAGSAYCTAAIPSWSCKWCLPGYTFIDMTVSKQNVAVYVARNDQLKEIVVGCRGSANAANVVQDLSFVPLRTTDPQIQLHGGFKIAADSVYPFIRDQLSTLVPQYPDYKVVLTGHSLGAAAADLAYYYLKREVLFPDTIFELYLYGLPRHGNKAYADYMNSQDVIIARVTSRGDIIPHIIPAGVSYPTFRGNWESYYHHAHEIWIKDVQNGGTAQFCSSDVYEDPKCSNSLGPVYSPLDHLIYYDVNVAECMDTQPVYYLLQFFAPLNISSTNVNKLLLLDPGLRVMSGFTDTFHRVLG